MEKASLLCGNLSLLVVVDIVGTVVKIARYTTHYIMLQIEVYYRHQAKH
jgi:hypothetical protein